MAAENKGREERRGEKRVRQLEREREGREREKNLNFNIFKSHFNLSSKQRDN
jgi:hypothetical protein